MTTRSIERYCLSLGIDTILWILLTMNGYDLKDEASRIDDRVKSCVKTIVLNRFLLYDAIKHYWKEKIRHLAQF